MFANRKTNLRWDLALPLVAFTLVFSSSTQADFIFGNAIHLGPPLNSPLAVGEPSISADGLSRFTCNTWDEVMAVDDGRQFDVVIVGVEIEQQDLGVVADDTERRADLVGEGGGHAADGAHAFGEGHLLGGAGGVEAVFTSLTIKHGIIPPTINYEPPDPECDLDYVPNQARPGHVDHIMSNSFGFGGHNATLIFSRYSE